MISPEQKKISIIEEKELFNIITKQKKEIKNLKAKYEKDIFTLNFIVQNLPGSIYWKNKNGLYLGNNDYAKRLMKVLGLETDVIGKTDYDIFPKEVADDFKRADLKVLSGKNLIVEEVTTFSDSTEMIQLSSKIPLLDKTKKIVGILGISLDITKLKKTELALQVALDKAKAASHAKTEFLENMRHDIRTPLSGIVGCAQIIKSQASDPEKVSEYAEDLIQSSEALLNFLNRILEGIKVATGETLLLKKKFDFKKNIQAILNLNKSLAAKKNLELTLEIDEKIPPYLIGDPIRLQRIILELMTNALRFTQQGTINIEAKINKREAQQVVIEIKITDTGIGIPADKKEDIFTRFTRLTPSHQGIYKGLGLGLSIVKQFVDDLEGEIYVESQLKQGTTFTCLLPFKEPLIMDHMGVEDITLPIESRIYKHIAEIVPNISLINQDFNSYQRKVLLVEDDKLAAKIAQIIFLELNCVIDVAHDAKMALQRIQKQDYHLVLMDIGLPDMDGITLTHRIRLQQWQRTDTTPIIGLTAHIDVENRQRCLDAGMNTVILKPLKKETASELLAAFVPDTCINQSYLFTEIRPVSGPVLDVDAMKALLKNEGLIKDCINLIINGLEKELVKLPELYQVANWHTIREIAHKLQGGASYCGAKRLEQACKQIVDYLRENGPAKHANALYQQLLQEMQAAKTVYKDYLKNKKII